MLNLPNELWIHIINILETDDIINLIFVNKFFFQITKNYQNFIMNNNHVRHNKYKYINHLKRINYFQDYSGIFKFYLNDFSNLNCNTLKKIELRVTNLYDVEIIKNNKNVNNLKLVNVYFKNDTRENIKYINDLKKLKKLTLIGFNYGDELIKIINKNFNLKELVLESFINLENFSKIENKQLNVLKINNCRYNDVEQVNELIKKQENIKILSLSYCKINNNTIEVIGNLYNNLIELNISFPQGIVNDLSVFILSSKCHKLEKLNLAGSLITNNSIKYLTSNCPLITELYIASTSITDMSLIYISMYYPEIKILSVEFNYISRIGMYNILLRCRKLLKISFFNDSFTNNYIYNVYQRLLYNQNG